MAKHNPNGEIQNACGVVDNIHLSFARVHEFLVDIEAEMHKLLDNLLLHEVLKRLQYGLRGEEGQNEREPSVAVLWNPAF